MFDAISTSSKKIKTKDCKTSGLFPVIDQGQQFIVGYIDDVEKVITVTAPIVIFGDHTRTVKWVTTDFVPGADGTKVLASKSYLEPKFFYYQIRSLELPDKGYARHFKFLKESTFFIPPLAEQQEIAARLDTLLAQVDTIKSRLDNLPTILKRFRQSILAAAVSGKLTEEWRVEKTYNESNGFIIPASWCIEEAKQACKKVQSGSTPRNNPFDQDGTIPFLKVYNIVDQKINFNYKPQFVTEDTHSKNLTRSIALPNDVLMNIVGPPLGKVAILTNQYPEWNLNQAITLFRVKPDKLLYKYLFFVLCEGELVRKVMPDTKGSVGQINISLTQCRESLIPVPPLDEQTEIVRRVEELFAFADKVEQRVNEAQARVNHLTQSILAKAFRGELTADWRAQNPELISGENSASALLARIKAEPEAQKPAKRVTKKKAKA